MTTTKNTCRLQIQRQKTLNDTLSMGEENPNEMYVNFLTEEELDTKIRRVLDSKRLFDYQRLKIRRFFDHIKKTGWFSRFNYKGYECAVEFDELGRWRIFFVPKKGEHSSPLHDHVCNCGYCSYWEGGNIFGLKGFPLGLWEYSDKIGLDDFIGLPSFSEIEWQFDYFRRKRSRRKRDYYTDNIFDINYAISMCKRLVECWIKYQNLKKPELHA